MRHFLYCFFLFPTLAAESQVISGKIYGEGKEILAYASVSIKGSGLGTTANNNGSYELKLKPGQYVIVCRHVGYKAQEKTVILGSGNVETDFHLSLQQYQLENVTVSSGGEDPAYAIIRKTIAKRSFYENELKTFQANVYIKGQMNLRDFPKRFMGEKVDFEDGDTSKQKKIFLSETIARYSVDHKNKKVEVLSTRVSGNSDALGFSSPQIISFYSNTIDMGRSINPRGFISPISDNALNFYNYKYAGSFYENGILINRISVTPKRKYEPLFQGYLNIIENEWRLYSIQLQLVKEQQMQLADTIKIEQLYIPLEDKWVISQQVIYPSVKIFGFDAYGSFVQVYRDFNMHPKFASSFFDNTILKFEDSANKKPVQYWDTIRPVPLQKDELADYHKKDSLEQLRKSPHYLDSLDKVRNKVSIPGLLLTGLNFSHERKKTNLRIDPLLDMINFNTVEGAAVDLSPTYTKRGAGRKSFSVTPNFRYGFSNEHFNAHISARYNYGKKYLNSISVSAGSKVFQFFNEQPITPRRNTISTLLYHQNPMKIYEAGYAKLGYSKGLDKGFSYTISSEFQDRRPLENTTDYNWRKSSDKVFTPNYPVEIASSNMPPNKALDVNFILHWQPGAKYIELPGRKISIGSSYPHFQFVFTQGIHGLLGSDVNYNKWKLAASQSLNLKIAGSLQYKFETGGFLNKRSVYLPDYQHFFGNEGSVATEYMNSFQLADYYRFSNTASLFGAAHVEYHLNGLLSNKIPLFKKLNWFFVAGANALHLSDGRFHYEAFFSVENILKMFRVDFNRSFEKNNAGRYGITIGIPGVLSGARED
ncbi:MAG: hypothetical protein JWN76_3550 [Chitinophagaceae bacterium]|nr:hypothetical protein [Chitinophagaceae bacterium]